MIITNQNNRFPIKKTQVIPAVSKRKALWFSNNSRVASCIPASVLLPALRSGQPGSLAAGWRVHWVQTIGLYTNQIVQNGLTMNHRLCGPLPGVTELIESPGLSYWSSLEDVVCDVPYCAWVFSRAQCAPYSTFLIINEPEMSLLLHLLAYLHWEVNVKLPTNHRFVFCVLDAEGK